MRVQSTTLKICKQKQNFYGIKDSCIFYPIFFSGIILLKRKKICMSQTNKNRILVYDSSSVVCLILFLFLFFSILKFHYVIRKEKIIAISDILSSLISLV